MTEILHELFVQIVTVLVMSGTIVLAVFLGHKFREFMDKRKAAKAETNEGGPAEKLPENGK